MTNQEAIETIKALIGCIEWDFPLDYSEALDMAIKALAKDNNVPCSGWISVKDKLPENKAVCLTYSPKGKMRVAEAFLPSSLPNSKCDPMECWWSTHGSGGARFVAVTHWMPLPERPKEEEEWDALC